MTISGPPDPPTRHMWGVGGAGPGVSPEEYARREAQAISAQSTRDRQKLIEAERLASHYLAEAQRRHQALNCIHAFLADIETSSLSMVEVKEIVRQWCDEANGYADDAVATPLPTFLSPPEDR